MPSNARVFEQAGNPWVSGKEGREKYGRTLETENPEADQHYYAKRAPERPPEITKANPKADKPADEHRKRVNVVLRMKGKMRKPIHVKE